jgi:hypothetical protein
MSLIRIKTTRKQARDICNKISAKILDVLVDRRKLSGETVDIAASFIILLGESRLTALMGVISDVIEDTMIVVDPEEELLVAPPLPVPDKDTN